MMRNRITFLQLVTFFLIFINSVVVIGQPTYPKVKLATGDKISLVPLHRDIDFFPYTTKDNLKVQFMSYILGTQDYNMKIHSLLNWNVEIGDQPGTYSINNNGKRAVVNILFLGMEARVLADDIYISESNNELNLVQFVRNVLQTGNYFKSNSSDYSLLVYQLDNESELKTWVSKNTSIHASTVFVLVSNKDIYNIPPLFQSEPYEKVNFSINKETRRIIVQMPSKIQTIHYRLGFFSSPERNETISPLKNYVEFNHNIHTKIEFFKPFGYNLVFKDEPDTSGMIRPSREISYLNSDTLYLKPVKYSLIYIDPTRCNKMEVVNQLDRISRSSASFHAYLSVKNKLYEAVDNDGIQKLAGLIYNQVSESALIDQELNTIGSKKLLNIASRMDIDTYLFLPDEVYQENLDKIKGRLTSLVETRKLACKLTYNVFISEDQRDFARSNDKNIKYYFLKKY